MNRTLEAMARALFQDWFVDFGPVRAKMEGREPYLPPELWELFPEHLVSTEPGEVPEGVEGWSSQRFHRNLERRHAQDFCTSVLGWRHSLVHRKGCSRLE